MKQALLLIAILSLTTAAIAQDTIISFGTMYGVDGPFVNKKQIRDVLGDELPWEIARASGSLSTDGHLVVNVTGLVFANDESVPPELRGINDEAQFRALVSCLVETKKKVGTVNVLSAGFPATRSGDATIDTFVSLPDQCVAPIIFVMSGSEDKWFAVTGAER